MKDRGYRARDISRLFGLTESQIKAWHRSGLVPHVSMEEEEPIFGFRELICFKVMKDLMDKGITPRRMKNYLDQLKRILPVMRERGGYIPTCDHGVPAEVKYEDYLHYRRRCVELGG